MQTKLYPISLDTDISLISNLSALRNQALKMPLLQPFTPIEESPSTPINRSTVKHHIMCEASIVTESTPVVATVPTEPERSKPMQYDDEGLTVRQKVKKVGNTHLLPKLNSNIGVDNSKYIININLAHDFRDYAHACKRLLKQEDTPGVIMIGCGRAITRLLKIA